MASLSDAFSRARCTMVSQRLLMGGDGGVLGGCACGGGCGEACPCGSAFHTVGGFAVLVALTTTPPSPAVVMECNSSCSCGTECASRVVQRLWRAGSGGVPRAVPVEVFSHEDAALGFGVRATGDIPQGSLLGEYTGVVVGSVADGDPRYTLCVREFTADGEALAATCVDASARGGVLRFVNHSCAPNATVVTCRVDSVVPHLCLFALRDIRAGEELGFDYGEGAAPGNSSTPCACGAPGCRGYLPRD